MGLGWPVVGQLLRIERKNAASFQDTVDALAGEPDLTIAGACECRCLAALCRGSARRQASVRRKLDDPFAGDGRVDVALGVRDQRADGAKLAGALQDVPFAILA